MVLIDDRPDPPAWRVILLYIKTRRALNSSERELTALQTALCETEALTPVLDKKARVLLFPGDREWINGQVLRFRAKMDALDFAAALRAFLDAHFVGWAVTDDNGGFVEKTPQGPMGAYFHQLGTVRDRRANYSRVFVMWDESDGSAHGALEKIRKRMPAPHRAVFVFNNGKVLFLRSSEPGSVTIRRYRRELQRFSGWCVFDTAGATFSASGPDESLWKLRDLENLR